MLLLNIISLLSRGHNGVINQTMRFRKNQKENQASYYFNSTSLNEIFQQMYTQSNQSMSKFEKFFLNHIEESILHAASFHPKTEREAIQYVINFYINLI